MQLYFLRHAKAVDPETMSHASDAKRPLTPQGIHEMKQAVEGIAKLRISFDEIVSSPYSRARETADLVAQGLEFTRQTIFTDVLTPDADPKDFVAFVRELDETKKTLFVGHQPSLGKFISKLISRKGEASIDIDKGGLCRVDADILPSSVSGDLRWLLTCFQLRSYMD